MNKDIFNMDLQLFSDEGADTHAAEEGKDEGETKQDEEQTKTEKDDTFTQEDVDRIIQERLTREKANHEREVREQIEKERREARRLAELSADEREKEVLKQREQELADRELKLQMKELELDTVDRLSEEGLPIQFKSFVMQEDADTTNENIKLFKAEWQKAIDAAVNEKLKGETPGKGGSIRKTKDTKVEDINKIMADARIINN